MKWTCLSARYLGCWQSIWNVVTAWLRAVSKSGYHLWLSIGLARVPIENDLWPMSSVGFGPSQAGITFQDFSLCLSPSAWIMTQHWYSGASFSGPSGITGSNLVVRNQKRETQFIGRSLTEASFARAFPPKRISRSIMNSFLNIPSLCWTKFSQRKRPWLLFLSRDWNDSKLFRLSPHATVPWRSVFQRITLSVSTEGIPWRRGSILHP